MRRSVEVRVMELEAAIISLMMIIFLKMMKIMMNVVIVTNQGTQKKNITMNMMLHGKVLWKDQNSRRSGLNWECWKIIVVILKNVSKGVSKQYTGK